MKPISDVFKHMGAPLVSVRQSWGAVAKDGTVILRVWQDEFQRMPDGSYRVAVLDPGCKGFGAEERARHLRLLEGTTGLAIVCVSDDKSHTKIDSYSNYLWRIGPPTKEGDTEYCVATRV